MSGFDGAVQDVAVSADGKLVAATGVDGVTTLWRRGTYFLPHPDGLLDIGYNPAGTRLATAGEDGAVRIWNTATNPVAATVRHGDQARRVGYAPDGTPASTSLDGTVRILDPDGSARAELTVAAGFEAREVAVSPDGRLLAAAARDQTGAETRYQIHMWELAEHRSRGVIDTGTASPTALAFTPDSSRLLATVFHTADPTGDPPERSELRSWRTAGLTGAGRAELGEQQAIHLEISPDGDTLAIGGTLGSVELRNLPGDEPGRAIAEHHSAVRQVAFSPDGQTLATITAGDAVVRLWDVATGELVASLHGHVDPPNAIAFAPDGQTLASAGPDGYLGLWTTDPEIAIGRICEALMGSTEDGSAPHPSCAPASVSGG